MNNCNDNHIFEMLGIGSREDSYTNLIHCAFIHNSKFQEKLLERLSDLNPFENHPHFDDWKSIIQPTVAIKSDTGRKKDIPDMVIFSQKAQLILLIENKTFSGEGWEQTKRYSDQNFKYSLLEYFKTKGIIFNNPGFKFYFLTLDGKNPVSDKFTPIKYEDIIKCIPEIYENSKLDILLSEFKERVNKYINQPKPDNEVIVKDYLHKTKWLVNSFRTFSVMTENLLSGKNLSRVECSVTGHKGSGYIPLCIWQKPDLWKGKKFTKENSEIIEGKKCYDIHFELQWDTRENNESITLYLHYSTNPYMTNNVFKKLKEKFKNSYNNNRDEFYNFVKKNNPPLWNISKTYLRIAFYKFDNDIKYGDLKETINALISSMTPIINEFIGKMSNQIHKKVQM